MTDIESIVKRWIGWPPEGLVEELEAALSAARGRWIPVGEKLPREDTIVMVRMESAGLKLLWLASLYGKIWRDGASGLPVNVTHWRELPEPPQEGGSNG